VSIIPTTELDRLIGIEPITLPFYLSLWVYVSLPPMLMTSRQSIVEYGIWIGGLCLTALTIFYFWPSAVPSEYIDWARYPGMAFLKGVDAAGNACPSLHVATAAFSCFWMYQRLPAIGLGRTWRLFNMIWCTMIIYSTMATKQHMALDVIAGIGLAMVFAWFFSKARQPQETMLDTQYQPSYGVAEE
jgi:membrane-associated phospholipid phosphatase